MLKAVVLLNIFVETVIHFFQDYVMNLKYIFCDIINVSTATFGVIIIMYNV